MLEEKKQYTNCRYPVVGRTYITRREHTGKRKEVHSG